VRDLSQFLNITHRHIRTHTLFFSLLLFSIQNIPTQTHTRTHTHAHAHMHIHICTHTHTYTHTHFLSFFCSVFLFLFLSRSLSLSLFLYLNLFLSLSQRLCPIFSLNHTCLYIKARGEVRRLVYAAVCCSVCCSGCSKLYLARVQLALRVPICMVQRVAVCCSRGGGRRGGRGDSETKHRYVCCSAVCCSVLQCVAVAVAGEQEHEAGRRRGIKYQRFSMGVRECDVTHPHVCQVVLQ